jgi:hypothetical protein
MMRERGKTCSYPCRQNSTEAKNHLQTVYDEEASERGRDGAKHVDPSIQQ